MDWELGVATRNDEPLLNQIFAQAIATIPTQTKQDIFNKWIPIEYVQTFDYDLLWKIVAGFSLLLIAIFFRNRQLMSHQSKIALKNDELAKINRQLNIQKTEVQHHADHDFLTGLPNRKKIYELLEHAIDLARRQQHQIAVIFLDLDRFKNINDNFGHHVGDDVLRQTADRLKKRLRVSDTIARIGGDEFLIIVETTQNIKNVAITAQNLLSELHRPFTINDNNHIISASIGIALFPDDAEDASTLIKHADSAMYLAKEQGKNNYQYYTQKLSDQTQRRLYLEQELHNAVKNEQLTLLFQPQIELKQQHIVGVEVLIRWQHPKLGLVSPAEFIPIAEETGLIVKVGEWLFRNACQTFSIWQKAGFELDSLAINVSSVQFTQTEITETFQAIIDEFNIPAKNIELEITERYLMADTEQNNHILQALRETGFKISVDDFGTGYSSMSYLKPCLSISSKLINRSLMKYRMTTMTYKSQKPS
jgi:diguanylate cyclase (GGDEF)-like protein